MLNPQDIPVGKPNTFRVQASAGSGKTHTLALLFLKYLAGQAKQAPKATPDAFRHLLAVTFTNKATQEMKDRILAMLDECARGDYRAKEVLQGLLSPEQARLTLQAILHDYSRFRVSTIDTFFQQVVRCFIRELGIHTAYEIQLDEAGLLEDSVADLLRRLDQPGHAPLLQWLKEYALERVRDGEKWDFQQHLTDRSKQIFSEGWREHYPVLEPILADRERMARIRGSVRSQLKEYETTVTQYAREVLQAIPPGMDVGDYKKGTLTPVREYAGGEYSASDEWGKFAQSAFDDPQEGLFNKKDSPEHRALALSGGIAAAMIRLRDYVQAHESRYWSLRALSAYLPELPVLADVQAAVDQRQKERGEYLLSSTTQLLCAVVAGCDTPFIYEKWGTLIEHYLLDEFQDTSHVQWTNFAPLLSESAGTGHSNLVVGDVKQSIYRWRNADSSIMDHLPANAHLQVNTDYSLNRNYRSLPVVVGFNNRLFQQLASRTGVEDIQRLYAPDNLCQHMPEGSSKQGGYVCVRQGGPTREDKTNRLEWVLERIEAFRAADPNWRFSDFAVLVREKKQGVEVAGYLREHGIPVMSAESLRLIDVPVIRQLVLSLHYLADTGNDIDRWQLRFLAPETARRLDEARDVCTGLPLYETIGQVIRVTGLGEDASHVAWLQSFMDVVGAYLRRNSQDLPRFLQWWKEYGDKQTLKMSQEQDAVSVVTLHKSKGLAYEVVFMPYLDIPIEFELNFKAPVLWCDTSSLVADLPVAPVRAIKNWRITTFSQAFREENDRYLLDNLNLFYVGCTRAKRALLLYAQTMTSKENHNVQTELLQAVNEGVTACVDEQEFTAVHENDTWTWGEMPAAPATQAAEAAPGGSEGSVESFYVSSRRYGLRFHTDPSQLSRAERGTLLHNMMSQVSVASDVDGVLDRFERSGAFAHSDRAVYEAELRRVVGLPATSGWFDGSWKVMSERTILTAGGLFRPDRVMLRNGEVLVVDYKFAAKGDEHARYCRQVRDYMDLLRDMGYQRVRGLLYYHLPGEVVGVDPV